jgi:hypothetical protein
MSRRTIQSPGIEIREIDLTQRPAAPIGTSVFIPGFSNQGPTDEVLNVGTFSDFEEIYGKPTNAAERYFYHSVKQTFNSDANVYVSRLPYGSGDGLSEASNKYTALVYPVVSPLTYEITDITSDGMGFVAAVPNGSSEVMYLEIVTKDSNNVIKYTSLSATATSNGSSSVISISETSAHATLSSIANDTIVKALVWPTQSGNSAATNLSAGNYYLIGNPTLVPLTEDQYNNIQDGNFTWSNDAGVGDNKTFAAGDYDGAGIIVLNKAKTTVNNNYEGYYVGITDGSNINPATDFDVAIKQYALSASDTVTGPAAFATVPTSRLDYALNAGSTSSVRNISRTLEEVPKFNIQGGEFTDTIAIGLFKVRVTPFSNNDLNLNYFLAEGYTGSLNSYRKIQNENGGERKSFFIEEQDDSSSNIKILVNPNISTAAGDWATSNGSESTKFVRTNRTSNSYQAYIQYGYYTNNSTEANYKQDQGIVSLGSYANTNNNSSKHIGNIPTKLDRIFNIASNVDQFTIDVSIEAGLGTIHATIKNSTKTVNSLSAFDDTEFLALGNENVNNPTGFYTINENMTNENSSDSIRDDYRTVFNAFEQFARETRKDHIFIADPLRQIFIQGENTKALDDKSKNFSTHVYWPLRHQFGFANSNYATVYGNWIKVYDANADKQVWVPFSGNAAGLYARNDANFAPWFAPAGYTRGIVSGVNDIAISPTQRQRDQLYRIAINPITKFPNEGTIVFGQKTLQRKPTAFDRVNVRRLFLDLEKRTKETLKYFIFEPNTFLTRTKVVNTLTPIFENAKQTEGVYDYLIVCDERNNTSARIENNELIVDIYLKPVRAAEFILVNFYAVNNDVNFEEIIGQ